MLIDENYINKVEFLGKINIEGSYIILNTKDFDLFNDFESLSKEEFYKKYICYFSNFNSFENQSAISNQKYQAANLLINNFDETFVAYWFYLIKIIVEHENNCDYLFEIGLLDVILENKCIYRETLSSYATYIIYNILRKSMYCTYLFTRSRFLEDVLLQDSLLEESAINIIMLISHSYGSFSSIGGVDPGNNYFDEKFNSMDKSIRNKFNYGGDNIQLDIVHIFTSVISGNYDFKTVIFALEQLANMINTSLLSAEFVLDKIDIKNIVIKSDNYIRPCLTVYSDIISKTSEITDATLKTIIEIINIGIRELSSDLVFFDKVICLISNLLLISHTKVLEHLNIASLLKALHELILFGSYDHRVKSSSLFIKICVFNDISSISEEMLEMIGELFGLDVTQNDYIDSIITDLANAVSMEKSYGNSVLIKNIKNSNILDRIEDYLKSVDEKTFPELYKCFEMLVD